MKFWRNAAALLMVFHPETTHTGNHSTPKDVKNEGRPGYVYENKWAMDTMPETMSDICARLKLFLQKIGVCSSRNTSKVPRAYRTDRDRGSGYPLAPPTPPYIRSRIRRFRDLSPEEAGGSTRVSPLEASPLPGSFRASPYPPLASSAEADWLAHGHA